MTRKPLSKRTRFEIFKRDSFTCQYCGSKPPSVILNVDHIDPVAGGGGNGTENLITSCQTCNLGKSDVPLNQVTATLKSQIEAEQERVSQVAQYNRWLRAIRKAKDAEFKAVSNELLTVMGFDPSRHAIVGDWASTIHVMLKRVPSEVLIDAIHIANSRFQFAEDQNRSWKYFCGVFWRKIERMGESK